MYKFYYNEIYFDKTNNFQLPGSTETAASFAFEKEDHTLGNALRYMILKKCDFNSITWLLYSQ